MLRQTLIRFFSGFEAELGLLNIARKFTCDLWILKDFSTFIVRKLITLMNPSEVPMTMLISLVGASL
jgi:hypothetical protein